MAMTLDIAIKNIERTLPSIAFSDSWKCIKAHLSAQAKVRVMEAVPNNDADVRFAREHNLFVYEVDFGDDGKGRYIRLSDFNKVCESFAARLSQGAQGEGEPAYWAAIGESRPDGSGGEIVLAYSANDGNGGEAARAECNDYINDAMLNDKVVLHLVPLYTHPAERAAVPDGWVLVPAVARLEQLEAACASYWGDDWNEHGQLGKARLVDARNMYDAVISAAPQPPEGARVVDGLLSSEGEWTVVDCPGCGQCVRYSKKDASSKEAYRDLTAEVTSLRSENSSLRTKIADGDKP